MSQEQVAIRALVAALVYRGNVADALLTADTIIAMALEPPEVAAAASPVGQDVAAGTVPATAPLVPAAVETPAAPSAPKCPDCGQAGHTKCGFGGIR